MRVGVWRDTRRRVNRRVHIRGFCVLRDMSDKFQLGHVDILEDSSREIVCLPKEYRRTFHDSWPVKRW